MKHLAVMYIASTKMKSKHKIMLVTGCIGNISQLTLMLTFNKHAAIRIGGAYCTLYGFVIVSITVKGLLSLLATVIINFLIQFRFILWYRFGHSDLLSLMLIGTSFYTGSINKNSTGIHKTVVYSIL